MTEAKKTGIITGCNERQEWMLKLWWNYYSQTNTYPVAFMDFGMTKSARLWCESKGEVISVSLPQGIPVPKEQVELRLQKEWEFDYEDVWNARKGWFYKPFALLQSPFEKTFWIDIDTFIIKPLTPLFETNLETLALVLEVKRVLDPTKLLPGETIYNTSVLGYTKNDPLIEKWAQKTKEWNGQFLGDQDILSRIIYEDKTPVTPLPSYFNVRPQDGIPPETFIIHFGNIAKKELFQKIYQPLELS